MFSFQSDNTSFKNLLSKTQSALVHPLSFSIISPITMPVSCLPSSWTSSAPNRSRHAPSPRMRALHTHSGSAFTELRDPGRPDRARNPDSARARRRFPPRPRARAHRGLRASRALTPPPGRPRARGVGRVRPEPHATQRPHEIGLIASGPDPEAHPT